MTRDGLVRRETLGRLLRSKETRYRWRVGKTRASYEVVRLDKCMAYTKKNGFIILKSDLSGGMGTFNMALPMKRATPRTNAMTSGKFPKRLSTGDGGGFNLKVSYPCSVKRY